MKKVKMVESALGFKTTEKLARRLDDVLKTLPSGQRIVSRKSDAQVTDINQGERSEVSVINSAAMDRDREIVLPEGIEYEDFVRYGTVLFGHEQLNPCGKCVWIKTRPDAMLAKTAYPRRPDGYDGEWLADFVWSLVQTEILKGKSIGFLPVEMREPNPEEVAKFPDVERVVTRAWLVEYSVVSTPCNPEALIEQIGKGLVDLKHFGWKTVGQVRKKLSPKIDHVAAFNKRVKDVSIDYDAIVKEVWREQAERWGV